MNKKRAEKLIKENRLTIAGLSKIQTAKKNGLWDKSSEPNIQYDMPEKLQFALDINKKAEEYFNQLSAAFQKQYIGWIVVAKRQETRERRIKESIDLLEKGQKLGLK
ncbi:YdeI/OmpD-associated family protein [bacterium]|nr:YdeI/OmpD-associated family protein [bacterium]